MADKKETNENNKHRSDRYDENTPDPHKYKEDQLEREQQDMEEKEEKIHRETNQRSKNP